MFKEETSPLAVSSQARFAVLVAPRFTLIDLLSSSSLISQTFQTLSEIQGLKVQKWKSSL